RTPAPHRRSTRPPDEPTWMQRRLDGLTVRGAAVAGIVTHLPGLVYLAALSAIVGSATDWLDGLFQILVYNAIWFLLPGAVLVLSLRRPELCRDLLERLGAFTRRHRRLLTVLFLGVFGGYLVWSGVAELAAAAA
ncbi:GAP family protein, partial [Pseudonocardia pini]|uniref:GAP family protein n=1 Tax=Pseudonocardia pini TaxID=2758030 RepID=UPI0015F023F6